MIRGGNIQFSKVSVIMPVYNRETTIEMSIYSVLNQTYSNLELIVVNDASTDETINKIYAIDDTRIKIIDLKKNVGAAAARNIGINHSIGSWIAFQDSDDYWEKEKLEKQLIYAAGKYLGAPLIVYSSFIRTKNGDQVRIPGDNNINYSGNIHKELLKKNFVALPAVLIPRECFDKVGLFDEEMPRFQDWELWIRMSQHYTFLFINEPLLRVYFTDSSISSDNNKLLQAYQLLWEKHSSTFIDAGMEYASRFLSSYGHNLALFGEVGKARRILVRSLRFKVSIYNLSYLVISVLGSRLYKYSYHLLMRKN